VAYSSAPAKTEERLLRSGEVSADAHTSVGEQGEQKEERAEHILPFRGPSDGFDIDGMESNSAATIRLRPVNPVALCSSKKRIATLIACRNALTK